MVAFGLGDLDTWESEYHPNAKDVERKVHHELKRWRRSGVGKATDIFDVDFDTAVALIGKHF
jgi:hypothetical protein